MTKTVAVLFVLSGLVLTSPASAQFPTSSRECHYCSEASYESMALDAGFGFNQIIDLGHDQLRLYQVSCANQPPARPNPSGDGQKKIFFRAKSSSGSCPEGPPQVVSLPPDAEIAAALPTIGAFWRDNGGSLMKTRYDINARDVPALIERDSVYAYHRDGVSANDGRLISYLINQNGVNLVMTQSFPEAVRDVMVKIINTQYMTMPNTAVFIRLTFNDGSYRDFKCDGGDGCDGIRSWDNEGNVVPEPGDINGTYSVESGDLANAIGIVRLIQDYGVLVCREEDCGYTGHVSVGAPLELECRVRANGDVACYIVSP